MIYLMNKNNWYLLNHPEITDSPALLIYPDRVRENINEMIHIAGTPDRLTPHIKTHKMSAVIKMQLEAGIHRFKCATIAEAELLAITGAKDILMAYQLNEPKALRFLQLLKQYPESNFASLVDNVESSQMIDRLFAKEGLTASVFMDIDDGMHRTGFPVNKDIVSFYKKINSLPHLYCNGLHVYDGHIHEKDFEKRKVHAETAFLPIKKAIAGIESVGLPKPKIIAGGSPTFPIHTLNPEVSCSPGTCLLWDKGYGDLLTEQHFIHAAVILTRIISKPIKGHITTDLGHKSVAAENPIDKRIFFLNLKNYKVISQSEEHLVIKVTDADWSKIKVGDVLYGIPYHICPTVALYDEVQVVENGNVIGQWEVEARRRKISV